MARKTEDAHQKHRVVIVGGGFAGLTAAKTLRRAPVDVTLVDRRNYHLFQPLLYQVAMAGLNSGDIAEPLRAVFRKQKNARVLMASVVDVDAGAERVILADGAALPYDSLIIATGVTHSYFGNDQWRQYAPGLKTIEDAIEIRHKVLTAFEEAERASDPADQRAWLTFVVVGGGPTGVELAGALAEMAHMTLRGEFRAIDPASATVLLVEGVDRVLPPYPEALSEKAQRSLERLGVAVRTGSFVTDIDNAGVTLKQGEVEERIAARTVIWAAGMKASPLGKMLHERAGASLDRAGRVQVEQDCSLPEYPNIYVAGDLAAFVGEDGKPLPGVAQVAMQQGEYVAKRIARQLEGKPTKPFRYVDKGSMATIGRAAAVAEVGPFRFSGLFAWLAWLFVHLLFLVGFTNRVLVLLQWIWNYFTYQRGVRLIVNRPAVVDTVSAPVEDEQVENGRVAVLEAPFSR